MRMPSYRRGQINDAMKKQLALIVRDIKDPRVANNFVSITAAEVAPDLKTAKVFFSAMTGEKKDITRGLVSATGFIRKRLAETLNLRITPELTFVADDSISYGAHINELLQQIKQSDKAKAASASVNDTNAGTAKEDTNAGTAKEDGDAGTAKEDTNAGTAKEDTNAGTAKEDTDTGAAKEDGDAEAVNEDKDNE